jgi:hypothetical protein
VERVGVSEATTKILFFQYIFQKNNCSDKRRPKIKLTCSLLYRSCVFPNSNAQQRSTTTKHKENVYKDV